MKKIMFFTTLLFLLLICFGCIGVSAASEADLTYKISNEMVTITDCKTSASGELVIPEMLDGYPVTRIGNSAFEGCNRITNIIIPNSVTRIDSNVFEDCSSLTSVSIPEGITSIGFHMFRNCSGLTSITIHDNVTTIGNGAFYGCTGLTSVTIPNSVTSIEYEAFCECTSLTNVTMSDSITSIGDRAFEKCFRLTNIAIPYGVTTIGEFAFYGCRELKNITIPNSVINIGEFAFGYCTEVTNVTIPDSVINMGNSAFTGCSEITNTSIGNGLEIIAPSTFYNCKKLKYVCLSYNLKGIQAEAFGECSNIETVFYEGKESQWNEISLYAGNENLANARKVYNVIKKTYKFETNCGDTLDEFSDYAIFVMPTVLNDGKTFTGWYDNEELNGSPVTFPYYGDATTLYAAWTDRTGKNFDDAFIAKANQEYTVSTTESGQLVYFEFVPKFSKEYRFYTTGSKDTYGYLYNSNQSRLASNDDDGEGNNFNISYSLTAGETYYIVAKMYGGTGVFTFVVEDPVDYRINEITIKDMSGNTLQAIPTGTFLATVSFTNVSSSKDTVIILAQYNEAGAFKGLMYIQTEDVPTGSTIKLSIPVDNSNGDVAKLKAFCWESFSSLTPMGNSASFPAE